MDPENLANRIESELASTEGREGPPPLQPPPRVADHQLIRRIGAGSYGEVWLARSLTGQRRGVKGVARARFASDRPYEREFRGVVRFEPISRTHSGLVQVLHVGRDDSAGAFYYLVELADDSTVSSSEFRVSRSDRASASEQLETRNPEPETLLQPETRNPKLETYVPRTLRSDLKARGRLPVAEALALGVQLTGALG